MRLASKQQRWAPTSSSVHNEWFAPQHPQLVPFVLLHTNLGARSLARGDGPHPLSNSSVPPKNAREKAALTLEQA